LDEYYTYTDNVDPQNLITIVYSDSEGQNTANVTLNINQTTTQVSTQGSWTTDVLYYNQVPLPPFTVNVTATDSWSNSRTCQVTIQVLDSQGPTLTCSATETILMSDLETYNVYTSPNESTFNATELLDALDTYLESNCRHTTTTSVNDPLGLCPSYNDNQNQVSDYNGGVYAVTVASVNGNLTYGDISTAGIVITFSTTDPSGNLAIVTCGGSGQRRRRGLAQAPGLVIKVYDDVEPYTVDCTEAIFPTLTLREVDINSANYSYGQSVAVALVAHLGLQIPSFDDNVALDQGAPRTMQDYLSALALDATDVESFNTGGGVPYSWTHAYSLTTFDLENNNATCAFRLNLVDGAAPDTSACPLSPVERNLSQCSRIEDTGEGVLYRVCNDELELSYNVTDALSVAPCTKLCMSCAYDNPACAAQYESASPGTLSITQNISFKNASTTFYLRRNDDANNTGVVNPYYEQSFVDKAGNDASCKFDILIYDDIAPNITCTAPLDDGQVRQLFIGQSSTDISYVFPNISAYDDDISDQTRAVFDKATGSSVATGSDGEGQPVTITCAHTSTAAMTGVCGSDGARYGLGSHTFTFTATDGANNTDTCSFTIEVIAAYNNTEAQSQVLSVMFTKASPGEGSVSGSLRYVTGFSYPYESEATSIVTARSSEASFAFVDGQNYSEKQSSSYPPINCRASSGGPDKDDEKPCLEQHVFPFNVGACGSFVNGLLTNDVTFRHVAKCLPNEDSDRLNNNDCTGQDGAEFDMTISVFAQDFCETQIDTIELYGEILPINPANGSELINVQMQLDTETFSDYRQNFYRYDNETGGVRVCFALRAQGNSFSGEQGVVDVREITLVESELTRTLTSAATNGAAVTLNNTAQHVLVQENRSSGSESIANNVMVACYVEDDPGLRANETESIIEIFVEMSVDVVYVLGGGTQRRRRFAAAVSPALRQLLSSGDEGEGGIRAALQELRAMRALAAEDANGGPPSLRRRRRGLLQTASGGDVFFSDLDAGAQFQISFLPSETATTNNDPPQDDGGSSNEQGGGGGSKSLMQKIAGISSGTFLAFVCFCSAAAACYYHARRHHDKEEKISAQGEQATAPAIEMVGG
jgi:hypothetical protein